MGSLSVIVITYNEERNLRRCLESVRWADEIIVVDSFSTDRTVDIAREFTPFVDQHAYDGDIPQRERGFARAKGDWLFYIDADEEVTPPLRDEILRVIDDPGSCDGYEIPRRVHIFGRWAEHGGWSPDFTRRLFRRGHLVAEYAEVHGGFAIRGTSGRLTGMLNHYTYDTIAQYLEKMNDYTSLQVSSKLREEGSGRVGPGKLLLSPLSHFIRKYIVQKGYRDGIQGLVLAALGALYTLSLYAKLWEYRYSQKAGGELPPVTNVELKELQRRYEWHPSPSR